ncbi:MAG: VOC family protein [Pseudobdellovibrionaceae bacterium]
MLIKSIEKPIGLHHVEIYVSNLEKSTQFWSWLLCENLGYSEYQKWNQGISFLRGKTYIVLVQTEDRFLKNAYHRCNVGLNHLAFHGENRDQIDHLTAELKKKGFRILYEDRHPHAGGSNSYAVFFEDPDRIKVEVGAP